MGETAKEVTPKPKEVKKSVDPKSVVKIKNISTRVLNTSKGVVEPDKEGTCTLAESRTYSEFLKVL